MSTELVGSRSWPAEPAASADVTTRMAWYAAVARWAPSKHNTQPWRFVIRGEALEFWTDPTRMLAETDPHRRELVISCGAAVQLACIAARAHGYQPQVSLRPVGDGGGGRFLARLVEVGGWDTTELDRELLAAVPNRRTDRGPLDGDVLDGDVPFLLQDAATYEGATLRLVKTVGDRSTLKSLVERADRLLVQRDQVDQELAEWVREPGDPRADGVPSDHTRGAAASYRAEFVQRDFSSRHSTPAQDRTGPDRPIVAVLCTASDQLLDWLVAGRALAAVLLRAAVAGAHASYVNQPVEVTAIRTQLRDQLDLPGVAQLVLRIGLGGDVTPPPRRDPGELTFSA